jgi:hypothetical protein
MWSINFVTLQPLKEYDIYLYSISPLVLFVHGIAAYICKKILA